MPGIANDRHFETVCSRVPRRGHKTGGLLHPPRGSTEWPE